MKELYDLTERQLEIKNNMVETANRVGFCFMDAKYRCIGKSTILRDIGLEYQALGYKVYVVTSTYSGEEYIADEKLTASDSGRFIPNKSIVLVDEMYLDDIDWAIAYFNKRCIPIMGFVRYRKKVK